MKIWKIKKLFLSLQKVFGETIKKPCDEASEAGKTEWLGAITVDEWSKEAPGE